MNPSVNKKFFRHHGNIIRFTVYDSDSFRTHLEVPNPNPGDIWIGPAASEGAHNIFVYGSLKGEARKLSERTPVMEWTAVPADASCLEGHRYRYPATHDDLCLRFLDMRNTSKDKLTWIRREQLCQKGQKDRTRRDYNTDLDK